MPPLSIGYIPELYISRELNDEKINFFQELIGFLCWDIELGRGYISTEVALLSRNIAFPHRGHLYNCLNIFEYLQKHPLFKLVKNPAFMDAETNFYNLFNETVELFEFYSDI